MLGARCAACFAAPTPISRPGWYRLAQVWDHLTGRLKLDLPYQAQEQFMLHDSAVRAWGPGSSVLRCLLLGLGLHPMPCGRCPAAARS